MDEKEIKKNAEWTKWFWKKKLRQNIRRTKRRFSMYIRRVYFRVLEKYVYGNEKFTPMNEKETERKRKVSVMRNMCAWFPWFLCLYYYILNRYSLLSRPIFFIVYDYWMRRQQQPHCECDERFLLLCKQKQNMMLNELRRERKKNFQPTAELIHRKNELQMEFAFVLAKFSRTHMNTDKINRHI